MLPPVILELGLRALTDHSNGHSTYTVFSTLYLLKTDPTSLVQRLSILGSFDRNWSFDKFFALKLFWLSFTVMNNSMGFNILPFEPFLQSTPPSICIDWHCPAVTIAFTHNGETIDMGEDVKIPFGCGPPCII